MDLGHGGRQKVEKTLSVSPDKVQYVPSTGSRVYCYSRKASLQLVLAVTAGQGHTLRVTVDADANCWQQGY